MNRNLYWLILGLAPFVGCAEKTGPDEVPNATVPVSAIEPAADGSATPTEETPSEDEVAQIKKLPEAEQTAALAQKICPISDEALGSMGVPIKAEAEGKTVYLCCKGCVADFEKDPKAALAKVSK